MEEIQMENKIIESIFYIRRKLKKRPSTEEIFNTLQQQQQQQSDNDIDIELFKSCIRKLENQGKIYNNGSDNKESYFVAKELDLEGDETTQTCFVATSSQTEERSSEVSKDCGNMAYEKDIITLLKEQIKF